MDNLDSFALNIDAARNLVDSGTNKILGGSYKDEGVAGTEEDLLKIDLSDEDLLKLRDEYNIAWDNYGPKIKPQQEQNKKYLFGTQRMQSTSGGGRKPISSNLLFEATATFVPAALAKNPEPVVWSDNTPEGKKASGDLKTMLQFHAETLGLREKLSVMVWHWSVYFTAVLKYGWDAKIGDITMEVRKPKNFKLQPDGYVDEFGNFVGWLGEMIEVKASKLIELFPKHKDYITAKVNGKMGTKCTYTEWWDDDMCFSTFFDVVLDKHKNEFFNYGKEATIDEETGETTDEGMKAHNHFAYPQKPYTFLSVFSLQEQPHDFTNLIEQNIANQDMISDRDQEIDKNLRQGNNSLAVSGLSFNQEIAHQAAIARQTGDPILIPDGNMDSIKTLPAAQLPSGFMAAQENNKNTLRSIYGTQGITASAPNPDQTAHGMVINGNRDSSRIGGGMGDSLERVARAAFNYLTQMYYVFYDEPHFAAVMGNGAAVTFTSLEMQDQERRFVVTVSANSMKPKDEVTEQNLATQLMEGEMLDPLGFFERIDDPDPQESATRLMLYRTNPQLYMQTYLSPEAQQAQPATPQTPGQQVQTPPATNAPDLSTPPANSSLSQAPLPGNTQPNI